MQYKDDMPEGFYTQGREQTHSLLQKVESSFRQMNYQRSDFELLNTGVISCLPQLKFIFYLLALLS